MSPFFVKSVIKFDKIPKISFNPVSLVFCSNDSNSIISCLKFIIDKQIFSFQYLIFKKLILNIEETSFVNLFDNFPKNLLLINIKFNILNLILIIFNLIKNFVFFINNIKKK